LLLAWTGTPKTSFLKNSGACNLEKILRCFMKLKNISLSLLVALVGIIFNMPAISEKTNNRPVI